LLSFDISRQAPFLNNNNASAHALERQKQSEPAIQERRI
jgi:hypothetical protein